MIRTEIRMLLPDTLLRAARHVAADRDITLGQLIRDGLHAEIRRAPRPATSPDRAEERRLALLRARYAEPFAHARDWHDLQARLKERGAFLQEAGGGLALCHWPGRSRICKASDLGASLSVLARRFRCPYPGHRAGNRWVHTTTTAPGETEVLDDGAAPARGGAQTIAAPSPRASGACD
jgi:hypothetical protein